MEQKHRLWKNRTIFFIIASNVKKKLYLVTPLISSLYMGFSRYSMEQKHRLWKNRTIFFIIASNIKKKAIFSDPFDLQPLYGFFKV